VRAVFNPRVERLKTYDTLYEAYRNYQH
jgi:hypothetical protein